MGFGQQQRKRNLTRPPTFPWRQLRRVYRLLSTNMFNRTPRTQTPRTPNRCPRYAPFTVGVVVHTVGSNRFVSVLDAPLKNHSNNVRSPHGIPNNSRWQANNFLYKNEKAFVRKILIGSGRKMILECVSDLSLSYRSATVRRPTVSLWVRLSSPNHQPHIRVSVDF